jgi:CRISPR/Cas system-associated exonuclease Cas4 (RecB family)
MLPVVQPRQVLKIHTIEQWQQLDAQTQQMILVNIKLKDRLHNWFRKQQQARNSNAIQAKEKEPHWIPCPTCNLKEKAPVNERGWILVHPRYDGLHPSQFGEACLLKIYNEMVGVPKQEVFEPRKQLIFDFGSALHQVFQNYGEKGAWGPMYEKEVPINREYQELAEQLMIEGSADAENVLVMDDIPNYPYIIEIGLIHEYKSINDNGFKSLRSPMSKHQFQATLYSAARNRPITVFLYMNKNDSNLIDFPIPFDSHRWAGMYSKGMDLVGYYHRQVPPPATTGFHCKECGYYYGCAAAKTAAQQAAVRRKSG